MGTWISHLRIAENLISHFPEVDEVTFTFGKISRPIPGFPTKIGHSLTHPKK